MTRTRSLLPILFAAFLLGGCAHGVQFPKPATHSYSETIPLDVGFYMNDALRSQVYTARSWMALPVNSWVVPVGYTVDQYARAYLSGAFRSFTELQSPSPASPGQYVIRLDGLSYWLKGQAAHSTMTFSVYSGGLRVLLREYTEDGPSGFGRVLVGSMFAEKSAIRGSTDVVFATIFQKLVADIRAEYPKW